MAPSCVQGDRLERLFLKRSITTSTVLVKFEIHVEIAGARWNKEGIQKASGSISRGWGLGWARCAWLGEMGGFWENCGVGVVRERY